jgi:hypothetical protein
VEKIVQGRKDQKKNHEGGQDCPGTKRPKERSKDKSLI